MKQLMTEWRSFLKESVVTHPRIVLNDNGRLVIIDIGKSLVRDRKQIPNIE